MMKDKLLNFRKIFYPFLAFLFGITMSRGLYGGNLENILLVVGVFILLSVLLIFKKSYKILIVLFAFFFIGNGFYFIGTSSFNKPTYSGEVSVVGRISDDIDTNGFLTQLVLDDVKINGKKSPNVKVEISNCSQIKVGEIMAFESKLTKSKMFNLGSFNSSDYRSGVRYMAEIDYEEVVLSDGYVKFDEAVRLAIKERLYQNMSEQNAGISYAVLFGDKDGVVLSVEEAYKGSGIIHVLSVSGLHVGFLTSLLYFVLKKCRANKYVRLIVSTIFLFLYAFLCGFTPSVVRAGVMATVFLLSKMFERRYDSLNSLGIAGFVICLFSPLSAFDLGFQMSFFCVAGILILSPSITKILSKVLPYKISSLIALSLSAQIGIIPIMANFFPSSNILSVFANLLIVPLFSLIYPILFIVAFISILLPIMGIFFKIVEFLLNLVLMIASFFASTNLYFSLSPFETSLATLYFLMVMAIGKFVLRKGIFKFASFSALALVLTLTFGLFIMPKAYQNQIIFLGNESEASVLIETDIGKRVAVGQSQNLLRYLQKEEIDKVDIFVATDKMTEYNFERLSERGVRLFVGDEENSQNKNFEIFEKDIIYTVGDFSIEYLKESGAIGVSISFAEYKIFVASNNKIDYNMLENMDFDVVFTQNGQKGGQSFILATSQSGGDCCIEEMGNFKLSYNGSSWKMRGID